VFFCQLCLDITQKSINGFTLKFDQRWGMAQLRGESLLVLFQEFAGHLLFISYLSMV